MALPKLHTRPLRIAVGFASFALLPACSDSGGEGGGSPSGGGGASSTGQVTTVGGGSGGLATGGGSGGTTSATSIGGARTSIGGTATSGGNGSTGGTSSHGSTGGTKTSGGSSATGGTTPFGGSSSTGGTSSGGTKTATGGSASSGGGGSTGGTSTAGGASSTGGTSASTSTLTPSSSWPTCSFTDADIQAAYKTWSGAYIADCSGGGKRVVGCGSSTCSEGLGYGMLIAVNVADKTLFDALWTYVDSLIPVPAEGGVVAGNNLVPWNINSSCKPDDYNNATDADLDIAMALVQAEKRWPENGYLEGAIPIIKDILSKNTAMTNGKRVLLTGAKQKVSDGGRPSYFAPGYYRVFIDIFKRPAYADPAQVTGWTELLDSTYALLSSAQSGMTNSLWPDWWPIDGSTSSGQAFGWDACRAPWRIATDYAWFASPDASAALLKARAVQPNPYLAAPGDMKNSAGVGALAFTAMPAGKAAFQTACDQWTGGALADAAYFQSSLKLLFMQLAGGFFPSTL